MSTRTVMRHLRRYICTIKKDEYYLGKLTISNCEIATYSACHFYLRNIVINVGGTIDIQLIYTCKRKPYHSRGTSYATQLLLILFAHSFITIYKDTYKIDIEIGKNGEVLVRKRT